MAEGPFFRGKQMKITNHSMITFNPGYITVDGNPWFPIMGEMHFSRYPHRDWLKECLKMKAGGVDVVSCYVIWIHHEEEEGCFDFSGDRDLKGFLQAIQDAGLHCILRIGPWAHGEARNGGFPDWLLRRSEEQGFELRADNEVYLSYVKILYGKIYEQAKGYLHKDGGPVIGVQIENEYGHCGGFGGEKGEQHMRTLQTLAKEAGFEVPVYTATGWGGAVTGGMLPVMGGYCEAPWDQRTTEIEPSGNYIFTPERNDHNIGSDHGFGAGITFDMDKFPYLTAELGGGLQVTRHRRPIASGKDTGIMSMVKLGSGVNLLGYYMYHGGSNPDGKLTTLQESRSTGYPNDVPVISYDFNAPLKEYGQFTDTYRQIRRLSLFTHDFEEELCRTVYTKQPRNPEKPTDLEHLRTSVRCCEDTENEAGEKKPVTRGFLFVNNYQRRYKMADHKAVELKAFGADGKLLATYPERDILDGDAFFYPFNMKIGKALLRTAAATPLCILHGAGYEGKGDAYVFYTGKGIKPSYEIEGDLGNDRILTLSEEASLHASKLEKDGREYLVISEGDLVQDEKGHYQIYWNSNASEPGDKRASFRIFPDLDYVPAGCVRMGKSVELKGSYFDEKDLATYESLEIYHDTGKVTIREGAAGDAADSASESVLPSTDKVSAGVGDTEKASGHKWQPLEKDLNGQEILRGMTKERREYTVTLEDLDPDAEEICLMLDYEAESGVCVLNGKALADSFYTGQKWEIGLSRFLKKNGTEKDTNANEASENANWQQSAQLTVDLQPLLEGAPIYLQTWPKMMENGSICHIRSAELMVQRKWQIL